MLRPDSVKTREVKPKFSLKKGDLVTKAWGRSCNNSHWDPAPQKCKRNKEKTCKRNDPDISPDCSGSKTDHCRFCGDDWVTKQIKFYPNTNRLPAKKERTTTGEITTPGVRF